MANKFKQAENKPRVAPGGVNPPKQPEEVVVAEPIIETPIENIVETTPETPLTVGELLTGKVEKKLEGKSVSLYLTTEALENLEKFAKTNKCSKSKAADLILRNLY